MLVKDRMSAPAITVRADADYKSALKLMQQHALHHVPVLDTRGRLTGIVAERDLLVAATRFLQADVEIADIMHRGAITVEPDTPITQAALLMVTHKIGGLPVVKAGKVKGVITETDVFRAFVDTLPRVEARMSHGRAKPAKKKAALKKSGAKKPVRAAAKKK